MKEDVLFVVTRRTMKRALLVVLVVALALWLTPQLLAQKVRDDYRDKFRLAGEDGGVAVTTSADGKYVYVAGYKGVVVSNDYGKTGSWVQTLKLK